MEKKQVNFSNGAQDHEVTVNHEGQKILNVVCKPALHGFTPKQFAQLAQTLEQTFTAINPDWQEELLTELRNDAAGNAEEKTVGDVILNEKKDSGGVNGAQEETVPETANNDTPDPDQGSAGGL